MTLEPKNIVLVMFILTNLMFLFLKKDLLNIVFSLITSIFLIIWYAGETIANQRLFYEFVVYLSLFLIFAVFILTRAYKLFNRIDNKNKDKRISVNRLLLAAVAFFLFASFSIFLLTSSPSVNSEGMEASVVAKRLDINNTGLAKEKYTSKTAILNESSIFVDIFSALEKVIAFTVLLLCFLLILETKKEIFFDKKK